MKSKNYRQRIYEQFFAQNPHFMKELNDKVKISKENVQTNPKSKITEQVEMNVLKEHSSRCPLSVFKYKSKEIEPIIKWYFKSFRSQFTNLQCLIPEYQTIAIRKYFLYFVMQVQKEFPEVFASFTASEKNYTNLYNYFEKRVYHEFIEKQEQEILKKESKIAEDGQSSTRSDFHGELNSSDSVSTNKRN